MLRFDCSFLSDFFKIIFKYRFFFLVSTTKDFRIKYLESFFGMFWSLANPFLRLFVYYFVFNNIVKHSIENYFIYIFVGSMPYFFFSSSVSQTTNAVKSNIGVILRTGAPPILFPLSKVVTCYSEMLINFFVLIPILLISTSLNFWQIVALPIISIPLVLFTVGIVFLISCSNLFYGDVAHLTRVFLRLFYFLCPIVYRVNSFSEYVLNLLSFNPMWSIVKLFQSVFYFQRIPLPFDFFYAIFSSSVVFILGLIFFQRNEKNFILSA